MDNKTVNLWKISFQYGLWCAEDTFGNTIWSLDLDELKQLFMQ